jgi:eukaryotic-like serine/threonine-protein kinase
VKSGQILADRYELRDIMGRGGFGEVWSALDRTDGRMRAVKFLMGPALLRPDGRARFLTEARIANAFVHPHLVQVHDVLHLESDLLAIVMELLEGQTLGQRLSEREPLTLREVAGIMGPIVSATIAIHERGIVHRDIKPDNIFLARTPFSIVLAKLLDFGIAKLTDHGVSSFTATGTTLGTPCYMAPEQAYGDKDVDTRADIFALGVVLYECLSGIRPIEATNLMQYVKQLGGSAIVPLEELQPDLPQEVTSVVMRMLSPDRTQRPSLEAVLQMLTARAAATPTGVDLAERSAVSGDLPLAMDETFPAPTRRKQAKLARTVPERANQVTTVDAPRGPSPAGWIAGAVGGVVVAVLIATAVIALDPGSRLLLP